MVRPQSGDTDPADFSLLRRQSFDPTTSDHLARLVVETVTAAGGEAAEASPGPPLYESVDIDAVFQVLFGSENGLENELAHEQLSFEYRGFTVVVSGEGRVDVGTVAA